MSEVVSRGWETRKRRYGPSGYKNPTLHSERISASLQGHEVSQTTRDKISNALKGHPPQYPVAVYDASLGHVVRSDWERELGQLLVQEQLSYEYERRYELANGRSYSADFALDFSSAGAEVVIEVKGVPYLNNLISLRLERPDIIVFVVGSHGRRVADVYFAWDEREELVEILRELCWHGQLEPDSLQQQVCVG